MLVAFGAKGRFQKKIKAGGKALMSGDLEKAAELLEESIELGKKASLEGDPIFITARGLLGATLTQQGNAGAACRHYWAAELGCKTHGLTGRRCYAAICSAFAQLLILSLEHFGQAPVKNSTDAFFPEDERPVIPDAQLKINELCDEGVAALIEGIDTEPEAFAAMAEDYLELFKQAGRPRRVDEFLIEACDRAVRSLGDTNSTTGLICLIAATHMGSRAHRDKVYEISSRARDILASDPGVGSQEHCAATIYLMNHLRSNGEAKQAISVGEDTIRILEAKPKTDPMILAQCRLLLGISLMYVGRDHPAAETQIDLALEEAKRSKSADPDALAQMFALKARLRAIAGKDELGARNYADRLIKFSESSETQVDGLGSAIHAIAQSLYETHFFDSAEKYAGAALKAFDDASSSDDELEDWGLSHGIQARVAVGKGEAERGERILFEALDRLEDLNQLGSRAHGWLMLEVANLWTDAGRVDDARGILHTAHDMFSPGGEEEEVLTAHTLLGVGRTLIKQGDLDGAEKVIVQAAEELRDRGEFGLTAKRVYKELLAARGGKWAQEHPDHPWLDIT